MMTLAIVSIVIGAIFAYRFTFFALAPVILFGTATTAVIIASGDSASSIVLSCIVVATGVQLGYLAAVIVASRAERRMGLMLEILSYPDELRKPEAYFDKIDAKPKADAVQLAVELIEEHSDKFEPQKMPNEYAQAIHELVRAKVEQRAPEVEIETEKREAPKVVNIMDALNKSMPAKGQTKVRDAVRKRMGKAAPKGQASTSSPRSRPTTRRTAH
jgi:hypothetical protein